MARQKDLAVAAHLHQSRISMFETPGMANLTLETLSKLAAAFKVGVIVKFVPFSEMLRWENEFSQDYFNVLPLDEDTAFIHPESVPAKENQNTQLLNALGEGTTGTAVVSLPSMKRPDITEAGSMKVRRDATKGRRGERNSYARRKKPAGAVITSRTDPASSPISNLQA
jgi:transcriptional regulator with XRE-family HTH domain